MNDTIKYIEICDIDALEEDSSKGFSSPETNLLVVKKDGIVYAYENKCPHLGLPLEMNEDEFLDCENTFIQCATHGALFAVDSGLCVSGPCRGESLTPLTSQIIDNKIVVQLKG